MEPTDAAAPKEALAALPDPGCPGFRILRIRGQKVILDFELARLYGISTRALLQAVRRNQDRFPGDFLFTPDEAEVQRLPVGEEPGAGRRGGNRRSPLAFTEQGVAMLSSVLRSSTAIRVNIEIMRAFVRLRRVLSEHAELAERLEKLERRFDGQFRVVFDALRGLIKPGPSAGESIGFRVVKPPPPRESNGAPRGAP